MNELDNLNLHLGTMEGQMWSRLDELECLNEDFVANLAEIQRSLLEQAQLNIHSANDDSIDLLLRSVQIAVRLLMLAHGATFGDGLAVPHQKWSFASAAQQFGELAATRSNSDVMRFPSA